MAARPLSPHLTVYRFAYTMSLSILHRITGLAMAVGMLVLVCWLTAAASGAGAYARFSQAFGHGVLRLLLGAWLVAFLYHLCNGIRHLFWDAGLGFERAQARRSAVFVLAVVVVLAAWLLYTFFCPEGVRS